MKLTWAGHDLRLRHAFTISRGTRDISPSVTVMVEHDGITGIGEAAPSQRYGETPATVAAFLKKIDLSRYSDPFALETILRDTGQCAPGNTSAKAAIDIALHDWIGKKLGVPLWKYFGLDRSRTPVTSFTIGIDTPENITRKVNEAASFPVLKIKVGVPDDEQIIRTIRSITDRRLRVDANEGWTSREKALDKISWMAGQGVEFVEQPMPADRLDDIAWLREHAPIPLIADESVRSSGDIPRLSGAFDGINVKLMKCGGIREAVRMIHTARASGMKIMLGCMIESSVAISAAAQISPLVDYADLDGNLLITNDPFGGTGISEGRIVLNDKPGLGVHPEHEGV